MVNRCFDEPHLAEPKSTQKARNACIDAGQVFEERGGGSEYRPGCPEVRPTARTVLGEQGRARGVEIAREPVAAIRDRVAGFAVGAPFGNMETALAVPGQVDLGIV